jgi:hypothetical protein
MPMYRRSQPYYTGIEPEKLTSLEGIEIAVREQMQNCVSKDIGIFLSRQVRGQKVVGQG